MLATIFGFSCCFVILMLFVVSTWLTLKKGINYLKSLHQIPCHSCEFFTNSHYLKCTVHPTKACSEQAIGCIDFEPKTSACNACQTRRKKLC